MRVFLLAPDFRTLGGFELQLATLAVQLCQSGVAVEVFFRQPVRADHPYRARMAAAGVRVHAPPAWLAALIDPPPPRRQRALRLCLSLLAPLAWPAAWLAGAAQRRSWRRAWQAAQGWLNARLAPLFYWDALTGWMALSLDWTSLWRRPDLVDVQHSMLPFGIRYGKRRRLPTIYTEYGSPAADLWPVWSGLVPVINQADFIIGRAEASLAGLRELCGASRPMAVVPNAVTQLPDGAAPAEQHGPEIETVITTVGRLAPEKGLFVLLDAFHLLLAGGVGARLRLAGDGPLRAELAARAQALGIAGQLEMLGSFDTLAPIMRATDILAHPTLNDGRSVAVLEAMAWGRPVVASRTGGLAEIVEDHVTGLLVPPGDAAALAAALRELALDADLRQRLGHAARSRFEAGNFTQRGLVTATLSIYHQVLGVSEQQIAS